jgi:hypothetical protein
MAQKASAPVMERTQVAKKFLRVVLPQVHARDFHGSIQAARLRPPGSFVPGLSQRSANPGDKFLHL